MDAVALDVFAAFLASLSVLLTLLAVWMVLDWWSLTV